MTMPTIAILGIDLGKKGNRIATKDHARGGRVHCRVATLHRCHICCGTHFLGRSFVAHAQAA